jgi:hypothetical protein
MFAGIVDCLVGLLIFNVSLQATTTNISSYMICQSYWKMYHWLSEMWYVCDCGLVHLAILCEMFSVTPIMINGWVEEDPLQGLHTHQV